MSSAELADATARVYQAVGRKLLPHLFGPSCAIYLVLVYVGYFVLPGLFQTQNPESRVAQIGEVLFVCANALFVATPLVLLALSYGMALTISVVSEYVLGKPIDERAALRRARQALGRTLGLNLRLFATAMIAWLLAAALLLLGGLMAGQPVWWVTVLLSGFAFAVGLISGPAMLLRDMLAPQAMALEGLTARQAMVRSRNLMRGLRYVVSGHSSGFVLGTATLSLGLILWLGLLGVGSMLGVLPLLRQLTGSGLWAQVLEPLVFQLPGLLALWLIAPVWTIGATLLYYERRVRVEALDIEMLGGDILRADRKTVLLS